MPAAGQPADLVSAVASEESDGTLNSAGVGSVSRGGPTRSEIINPWNVFQHQFKGKGLTSTALAKMYNDRKKSL